MRVGKVLLALVLIFSIMGCAMLQPTLPETPRDKSDLYMGYYMAQLLDYNNRYTVAMQNDVIGAMELKILEAKYTFLQKAWEPIALYDSYITDGKIPPPGLQDEIDGLISLLENALEEGRE
jgi:hypothetical protein